MGYQAHCIVMEELSRASGMVNHLEYLKTALNTLTDRPSPTGSIALSYAAHSQLCINQLSLKGTVAQKSRFLPPLISGAHVGALAMSEASAGSDVVSMRTTATATPSAYEVNGTKMWITNGPDAHTLVLYTKTDPSAIPPSRGITAFVVPTREVQGFACTRKLDKLGMRGSNTGELSFSGMALPAESVLGEVNGGVRVLMEGLDLERLVLSAGPIGLMQRALEEALPYAHERVQFGQPIAKQSLLQGKLADMYTATQASRALTMETARRIDEAAGEVAAEGLVSSRDCTATILFAAEQATRVCLDAVQVFGGMGYLEEEGCAPVARLVRDAKLYEIGAGTSEIRRIVVGRSFGREFGVR